ncbi:MAG TPA: PRC-barrel domain-containing protein [Actinomycetota bacterium]|nr:PRC-barrel domain-containing protein [Actinomycetota bacterium]
MPAFDVARRWKGRVVLDRTGDKLGSVLDVFYDAENDEPGWVLLGEAGAGEGTRLVPVAGAIEHGNELRVPFDRAFVEGAPGMEPGGRLWPQEEAELYAYYGLPYTGASLVDLDEEDEDEDEDAAAQIRGLPPR